MADVRDTEQETTETEELVPDEVIPHQTLPALRYRDMPSPIPWRRMIGPGIILAGLSLGSGEFLLWPYIVYKSEFVFFWACVLGVITQFFLNMEIERWTLATGETAITGFCRMSRHWAWVMLLLNIIPWAWPAWATGAGQIGSWFVFGPESNQYVNYLGIAGLILVGAILTAGPVVYQTVEKIQTVLVGIILVIVIGVAAMVVRWDSVEAMFRGSVNIGGMPDLEAGGLSLMMLLGALAFAGAGGTTNLGQSNYINDKGYGMGRFIGRITSPLTGQPEAIPEVGYHFRYTDENMQRWRGWWRAANIEQFLSFFLTCLVCLCLLSLIAHSLFYSAPGELREGVAEYGQDMDFVLGEANLLGDRSGGAILKYGFLFMGIAILLTTELGVLDVTSRISADIVKVNYLAKSRFWTPSRLYYVFLWSEITLGVIILCIPGLDRPLFLVTITAALNGGVMFLYSLLLLYMNNKILSRRLSMSPLRFVVLVWSCAFFGYFSFQALRLKVMPEMGDLLGW